ncbi:hypothetical protein, partial [Rheinheimera sp.]|uniref:hypothetical protein n=1 Tax=Rheinheimera sp. TaxID=1869214 RepID=UPI0037C592A0
SKQAAWPPVFILAVLEDCLAVCNNTIFCINSAAKFSWYKYILGLRNRLKIYGRLGQPAINNS